VNILDRIIDERRADVVRARAATPIEALRERAPTREHHSLVQALGQPGATHIVAEMKKGSPSAGLLRESYHPAEIARSYARNGAVGVSVLTEARHFQGCEQHLRDARTAVSLPILRKDFFCDPYQVVESAAWGADVVLLIVAALDVSTIRRLYEEALGWGLEVLAEAHTEAQVETALELEEAIVGVNSRDLKTLRTDLSVARGLARQIPAARVSIAESGIKERCDIEDLESAGYNGFLIGESLMAAPDPASKLRELLGRK